MFNFIKIFSLWILLIQYAVNTLNRRSCVAPRKSNVHNSHVANDVLIINQTASYQNNYYLPEPVCDQVTFKVTKTINPYRCITEHLTHLHQSKSICFQCAICLAVANKINQTIQTIPIGKLDPNKEIKLLDATLKTLCRTEFDSYGLRIDHKYTSVTIGNYSVVINDGIANMQGRWSLSLRETCSEYIDNIDVNHFYKILLRKKSCITNYICRGDGIFRNCLNVEFRTNPASPKPNKPFVLFEIRCTIK